MEGKISLFSSMHHRVCRKNEVGFYMIVFCLILSPVQPTPQLVQTVNDTYVFNGTEASLRCEVRDAENNAIVWQYVDGLGAGTHIGKCYVCPADPSCELTPRYYTQGVYSVERNGDVFQLDISSSAIPTSGQPGHYECAYININCNSPQSIPSNAKYRILASTNLFVYDDPQCFAASGPPNDPNHLDFACLKYPRTFRDDSGAVTSLGFQDDIETTFQQLALPLGVIQRVSITDRSSEINGIINGATCTLTLPSGLHRTQNCREAGIYLNPSMVSLTGGQTQSMDCSSDDGADARRQWHFFRQETLSKISASEAGLVHFTSDTNVTLEFTPHNDTEDLIVECLVEKTDGSISSAFAFVFVNADALNGTTLIYEDVESTQYPTSAIIPAIGFTTYNGNEGAEGNDSGNGGGVNLTLILAVVSPAVAIAVWAMICVLVVKKRKGSKSVKQPPRSPDATFQSSTNIVTTESQPNTFRPLGD